MSRPAPRAEGYSLPDTANETPDATARSNSPGRRSTNGLSPDAQTSSGPDRHPLSNQSLEASESQPAANLAPAPPQAQSRRPRATRKSPQQIGKSCAAFVEFRTRFRL